MPQARDIKSRIGGINNIRQITRAMKMVATAKLRRAQTSMLSARPYASRVAELVSHLSLRVGKEGLPLLERRDPVAKRMLVVITGDKGLCGAFNNNIIRTAEARIQQDGPGATILYLVGRKCHEYFKKRTYPVEDRQLDIFRLLEYESGEKIADTAMSCFLSGKVDEVHLLYNRFRNMISQEITLTKLLPLGADGPQGIVPAGIDYLYEPSKEELLRELLPHLVRTTVWQALLESAAAEHAARMTAMENATTNAEEMIDSLTLVMNKIRQATITRELIEVVSSAEALK